MSDNVVQTVQHILQDVIAPDVRELKANQVSLEKQLGALEKHMEARFESLEKKTDARFESLERQIDSLDEKTDSRFDSLEKKTDAQFNALLAAISESRAQAELTNMRVIASLSERVAVLESQRH
jgi:iron uptake system EfeUOB component EfeO/EfeM